MGQEQGTDDFFKVLNGEMENPMFAQQQTQEQTAPEAPEPKDEPKPTPPEKPGFNVKEYFPEYESIDEIKEKLKGVLPNDEISALKEKATRYDQNSKLFESLKEAGLNQEYLRLQLLENQKSEKVGLYKKLLYGELQDIDLIKLDLIDKYPELKDDKEMLQFQLEEKFPQLFGEDVDIESQDYSKAQKKLQFEANQIRKRMKGEFESVALPDELNPEYRKTQIAKTVESWKPDFESHTEELTTIPVELDGGDKFMDITIPEKERSKYLQAAVMYIADMNLPYNKASLKKVKDFVAGLYIQENLKSYNKAILDKRAEMSDAQWRKFIHNPKPSDGSSKPKTEQTDGLDKFFNELMNR